MNQRIPILVYHHVYQDDHPELVEATGEKATGVIGESRFRRQMSYIAEGGWTVVSTSQVVDWLEKDTALPQRSAVLHFDNGWLDTCTIALPILREYGLTGTSYVISDATEAASQGKPALVRTSTEGYVERSCITWAQGEELLEAGWEIGAHTATHPRLADLHAQEGDGGVLAEVERSNAVYAQRLGFVPAHFAYPSGSRNERTDALLAPFYRSLRLWSFSNPPVWTIVDRDASPLALECQNIDSTVSFEDFVRIFDEALGA